MINLFQPSLDSAELDRIGQVLSTHWIGKGPKVTEFEAAWAKHIDANPANVVSTNSCTEGLFQAVQLLGIGKGDEVIIPTIHFVGTAQAVIDAGARPVFCDVDSRTLNATVENLNDRVSTKTTAVIYNHYGGVPCDAIIPFKARYPWIKIIEDAACAPASSCNGQAVGTFGDIGVWSFDAMKIISTGDGGMMYIRDKDLANKARKQLYLGTTTQGGLFSDAERWWEFEVEIEGARRSVMNDITAAMGLEQLKKLDGFIERRIYLANFYNGALDPEWCCHIDRDLTSDSYYFYWIQTPQRDELARFLRAKNIYVTFRYYPLHWVFKTGQSLPGAEQAARETLLLPLHQGLDDDQVSYICEKVRGFYGA